MSLGGCGLWEHLPLPLRLTYRPVSEGPPAAASAAKGEREQHTEMETPESSGGEKRRERTREDEEEGGREGEREEEGEGKVERAAEGETVAESQRDDFEENPRPKPLHPREEVMDTEEELPQFPAHPFSYFPPDAEMEEQGRSLEAAPSPSPPHPLPMQLDTQPAAALLIQQTLQSHAFPPEGSCESFHSPRGMVDLPSPILLSPPTYSSSLSAVVAAQMEELQSSHLAQVGHTPQLPPLSLTPVICLSLQATPGHTHKPHPCSQHSQKSMMLGVHIFASVCSD